MTESKPPAAPDGEGPYRVEQTIAGEWAIVGPTIEGERTADEETTRLDCAELNAAFTAGQQHRSDGGEVAAAESHDYPLISAEALARRFHETYERRAPDFGYKTREESAVPWPDVPPDNRALMIAVAAEILDALTPAPRREGELYPCGNCGHIGTETDGSIEAGSNCVKCGSRDTSVIYPDEPPSADLVAAARGEFDAIMHDFSQLAYGEDSYPVYERFRGFRDRLAALQNTPQPDELEAVKLLRELAQAAADVIPHIEQPFSGRSYVSDNLDEARRKADTFLFNTPEVDQ